jgi:hypothetical protein
MTDNYQSLKSIVEWFDFWLGQKAEDTPSKL